MYTLPLFLLWTLLPSPEGARIVIGKQRSRFLIRSPDPSFSFPDYRNNGYAQKPFRENGEQYLEIVVRNTQLASKIKGRRVAPLPEPLKPLERELDAAASGRLAGQVAILVQWLRREVRANDHLGGDQDVAAVLGRKEGNCVGIANLMLFVLEKMGVQARYVTGIAFKATDRVHLVLEGDILHRWIEIHYDDVGWVFCDPAGKVNFVEATYLVLGVRGLHSLPDLLAGAVDTHVELIRFENGFKTIGALRGLDSRLRVRPNRLFVDP